MCTPTCVRFADAVTDQASIQSLIQLYEHPIVRMLATAFADAGGQLFLVGGPVRDALRGHTDFADLDFTTNLRPEQTKRVLRPLGTLWTAGERYGTVAVAASASGVKQKVEVTTFRTETYSENSRKPTVGFGDGIVDDLRRRDLTVNAIALNAIEGCVVDPYGGIAALADGVLDTPDDPVVTLSEDPLRILRVIRFATRLGAAPAARLRDAIVQTGSRLEIVAAERRFDELTKVAGRGTPALAEALDLAADLGVLEFWVPHAFDPRTLPGSTDTSTLADLESLEEVLAVLVHQHRSPAGTLRSMKAPGQVAGRVETLLKAARSVTSAVDVSTGSAPPPAMRRLVRSFDDDVIAAAGRVHAAVSGEPAVVFETLMDVAHRSPQLRAPLPVDGNDLMALGLEGRQIGAAMRLLEDELADVGELDRARALELAGGAAVTG